jgi:hypothetical protein
LLRIVKAKVEKSFITEWMFILLILLVTMLTDSHSIEKEINIYVGVIEAQRESERGCRSRLEPDNRFNIHFHFGMKVVIIRY